MFIKKAVVLFLVFSMLISITACSRKVSNTNEDPTGQQSENKNGGFNIEPQSNKIVGWLWSTATDDPLINSFIKANPDFEIDNSTASCGVWGDKTIDLPNLAAKAASDESPDLFQGWMRPIEAYYTDLFMPVQPYFDNDPDFPVTDYDPVALQMGTFNKQIYFVPMDYSSAMFVWNKKLFEESGVNPDTPPKTWSEFMDLAAKLTTYTPSGDVKTIGTEQMNFAWDSFVAASYGTQFTDPTGLKFNWKNPAFVEIFEMGQSIGDTFGGNDKIEGKWIWLMFGNVAMGLWSGTGIRDLTRDNEIGIAKVPVKDGITEYHSRGLVDCFLGIPRTAKNPGGAWKMLKHSVSDGRFDLEFASYSENPDGYIPFYIPHKPTRQKMYDTFEPLLPEDLFTRMVERDEHIENVDMTLNYTPIHNEIMAYVDENKKKVYTYELTAQDFVNHLQELSETLIAEFIERKESEGWTFTEEGGIPPVHEE